MNNLNVMKTVAGLTLLGLLASCGSQQQAGQPSGGGAVIHSEKQLPAIPAPQQLATPAGADLPSVAAAQDMLRSGSFTLADGFADGAGWSDLLPNQRTSRAVNSAVFAPAWPVQGGTGDQLAFAVFPFTLPAYADALVDVAFSWADAPADGQGFFALANFDTGRWDWYAIPAAKQAFPQFGQSIDASDTCLLAVMCVGTDAVILDSIQISTAQPPVADILADTDSGVAPLSVSFDGSGSTDPDGNIANYEWDLDGDSLFNETGFEQNAEGSDNAAFEYGIPGSYTVSLRVTDDGGFQDEATVEINVSASQPPVADLQADVTTGPKPLMVTFNATASMDPDGSVTDYEWDFDGDNQYGEAGAEADAQGDPTPPAVTYASTAVFPAHVRVTDNDGGKDSAQLDITVTNTPPTAALDSNPQVGDAPLAVDFDASGSSDPGGTIIDYEWDFDGDGLFNEAGTEEETARGNPTPATYIYTDPGNFSATVRVTDDDNAEDIAADSINPQGWVIITIPNGDSAINCDIAEINGHPAICWRDGATTGLRYAYSQTSTGLDPADWSLVDVDSVTSNAGWNSALVEVAGAPAIAQISSATGILKYHRASTATGAAQADWDSGSNFSIDTPGNASWAGLDMDVISGNPAICCYSSTAKSLKYYRSNNADGGLPGNWSGGTLVFVHVGGGLIEIGYNCSMAEINGNPAIAYGYYDDNVGWSMYYVRSTSSTGNLVADWANKVVLENQSCPAIALQAVNGNPAIAYMDQSEDLRFRRAGNSTGALLNDWTTGGFSNLTLDSTGSVGNFARLVIADGNPAIVHRNNGAGSNTLRYLRSSTASGAALGEWTAGTAENIQSGGGAYGEAVEFEIVDGRPSIVLRGSGSTGIVYGTRF